MATLVPLPPATAEDVPQLVVFDGIPYCVVKSGGVRRAFVAACSYEALPLVPLRMKKGAIVCPHHGATFDCWTGQVAKAHGNDVPTGLVPVDIVTQDDGTVALRARKRFAKLLKKKARRKLRDA